MSSIYEFKAKALGGSEVDMSKFRGHVLLLVNTASECGFTPQYAGLQKLNDKYAQQGLDILGFPCNQFGHQEPGDSSQIANFCSANYGVTFQMFDKVDVNGDKAHPLWKYLTHEAPGLLSTEAIKWNFTKFLVSKDGKSIKRYAPNVDPADIAADIESELKAAD